MAATAESNPDLLWYDKPAVKWEEALPVGKGRLGTIVFGQPAEERLQLNEGTLWAGGPYAPVNPEGKEALPKVRQMNNEGNYREAARLISASSAGQLWEWLENRDMRAPKMHHRHVSHLYGLYPGRDIHRRDTPDLAAAQRRFRAVTLRPGAARPEAFHGRNGPLERTLGRGGS